MPKHKEPINGFDGADNHAQDKAADAPTAHGQNDLFRETTLKSIPVTLIDVSPRWVRRALDRQERGVMRAIERFGFRVPILVRSKADGERYEVIDGHTRLVAAGRLGAEEVPCILVDDLPDVEVRRLALSLNKLQETGAWDKDALKLEINEVIEISGQIEIPGFSLPEIDAALFGDDADAFDDFLNEKTSAKPISQPGDIWHLGDHLVCCGSARDGEMLHALLEGALVDAVFADPPYNVKINGHVRGADQGFAEFTEASGEMSREEFVAFLQETLGIATEALRPGGIAFICMDWRHVGEMTDVLNALKLELLNICVWVKSTPGMGALYRSQHEFVFVARKPGKGHLNNVQLGKFGRNRPNVWQYAGATGGKTDPDDTFDAHPTVKPIRMVMDALLDVTKPGDVILDPFLGSGTTLLSAERTRRRCIGIEIAPHYVDLTIQRWQDMTGAQAVHAETGDLFDDRAAQQQGTPSPDDTSQMEDF